MFADRSPLAQGFTHICQPLMHTSFAASLSMVHRACPLMIPPTAPTVRPYGPSTSLTACPTQLGSLSFLPVYTLGLLLQLNSSGSSVSPSQWLGIPLTCFTITVNSACAQMSSRRYAFTSLSGFPRGSLPVITTTYRPAIVPTRNFSLFATPSFDATAMNPSRTLSLSMSS